MAKKKCYEHYLHLTLVIWKNKKSHMLVNVTGQCPKLNPLYDDCFIYCLSEFLKEIIDRLIFIGVFVYSLTGIC
jgi:hypothetical protein